MHVWVVSTSLRKLSTDSLLGRANAIPQIVDISECFHVPLDFISTTAFIQSGSTTHRIIQAYIRPSTNPHPSIHPSTHSSIHLFIHPSTHSSIHSAIHPTIHLYTHSNIHSSIQTTCPLTHISSTHYKTTNKTINNKKLPTNWAYGRLSHARGPLPIKELTGV